MGFSHRSRRLRWGVAWLALLATGCTTLREIPRGYFSKEPERPHVRILTRDGLVYEFDYARVTQDSLIGFRRRDVGGRVEQFDSLPVALDDVTRMSVRSIDWYRTSLIGGGVALTAAIAGLVASASNGDGGSSGGGGIRLPD